MKRRTVRITPLGYIVLIIIVLVMVVSIYFIVWSMRNSSGEQPSGNLNSNSVQTTTPTPSLAPVGAATTAPIATTVPTTAPPAATTTITPKQDDTPEPAVKTPTAAQVAAAVDGTLNASGVVLRSGPAPTFAILAKYSSGTQLKVYEASGDYYYVRVVKENLVGYVATKFVDKAGLVPGENATPTPKAIAGTIPGTVSASKLALRSMPSTEGNTPLGQAVKGDSVLIFFKTGDFYYIQVVATGMKCYAAAKYITASTAVPTGTPVP